MIRKSKALAIFLASVLLLSGCAKGVDETEIEVPAKSWLAAKYCVEESEIDEHHTKYPKYENNATAEEDFASDRVIIMVYSFANGYLFQPSDFDEVGCTGIKELMGPNDNKEKPTRMLLLTLNTSTKQEVLDVVDLLLLRADIYFAQPDYVIIAI